MRTAAIAITTVLSVTWASCRDRETAVDFTERVATRAVARSSTHSLRVAIAGMISPKKTENLYVDIVRELGRKIGERTTLVHGRTYAQVNALLGAGKLDLAFLCTGGYLALSNQSAEVIVLAVPQVEGKTTYESLVIVRASNPAKSFVELKGAAFAFTDPLSHTGHLYPWSRIKQLGFTKDSFLSSYVFVGSHDRAIRAVQAGQRSAAAVDSLVYRYLEKHAPDRVKGLRVLERSPSFGIPPVVASAKAPAARRKSWREALLAIHHAQRAKQPLKALGIERFVVPPAGLYQTARALYNSTELTPSSSAPAKPSARPSSTAAR